MTEQTNNPTPAKRAKERRTELLPIRLTKAEKQKIAFLASAANAEMSEFVRAAALNRKPKPITSANGERRAIIEALAAFGKMRGNVKQIGDNLNMIARAGNRGREISANTILYYLQEIEAIGDMLRSLLNHPER